jgi:DNA helicase-2/ATP-dependent DNA helicase PcrA
VFEISSKKQEILDTTGNLLVMGGPGSGKTTIALLKANHEIHKETLNREQKILFLSFARATITRVEQHAKGIIEVSDTSSIEITTYHSFIWTILKSHGNLLISQRLQLLPPHDASSRLSSFTLADRAGEKERLFHEEGLLHFDLFAKNCTDLLSRSVTLSKIIANAYPIIILDEFQDTNQDEWELMSHLGKRSVLIALADSEQRIYDFRGADPARIRQFIEEFNPIEFDFGSENNRSNGTDIIEFGNDLLSGRNKGKKYNNVQIVKYTPMRKNAQLIKIKSYLLKKLSENSGSKEWSLAVLTPSNRMMLTISEFIGKHHKMSNGGIIPAIVHDVALDPFGPSIAAIAIAKLLEAASMRKCGIEDLITPLCEHILGRRSNGNVPKSDQELAQALTGYIAAGDFSKIIRGTTRQAILNECNNVIAHCNDIQFTGDIATDWVKIRDALSIATTDCIKKLHNDSLYIKLLHKGSMLNSGLAQVWRNNGNYFGATETVRSAITQEHFATSSKTWNGINVMTIHKSKGKEFDEVIIYEGMHGDRIVYGNDLDKARLSLRVAVTRAKSMAFIFTPDRDICPLI